MSGVFANSLKIYFGDACCNVNLVQRLLYISKMPFYAVARGRVTGVFQTWADCEAQVKGFSGAKFKKFDSVSSANEFIKLNSNDSSKRAYSSTSNNNLKRSYASSSSSNSVSRKRTKRESDSSSSEDDLNDILLKQLDDVEKRVNVFTKAIDKITKSKSKMPRFEPRQSILIQPPQPQKFNTSQYEEDHEGYVQVYTDGACSDNGRSGARAGLGVYWGHNHRLNRSQPVTGRPTNNSGEIQAATLAIKIALQNEIKKLTINTDSQFLINSVTKWMPGWKRRGWKLSSGESVKNETDFKELDSIMDNLSIKWNYVKAHSGLYGNEMADKLAKAGAAMYK